MRTRSLAAAIALMVAERVRAEPPGIQIVRRADWWPDIGALRAASEGSADR